MADLRIGVVGAGLIGQTHIETIGKTDGFRLAAIADPGPQAGGIAARKDVPHYTDVEDLLVQGGLDGVIVATPNELHVSVAQHCLNAGLPVLLEKPVANTLAEARRLIDTADHTGVPVLIGHQRRHNPVIRAAKAAIEGGAIGELVMATVTCSLMKPADYFGAAWRRQPGVGGPLLINLIHEVDLVRHFFGDVSSARAMVSNAIRKFEVEDTAAAILEFERGGMATLCVSDAAVGPWAWDLTAGENPGRFPAHPVSSHFFCGSEGGLSLPDLSHWSHRGEKNWFVELECRSLAAETGDPYVAQLRHFGEVIAGRAEPLVSAREGTKDLATIAAIHAAAASGRPAAVAQVDAPAPRAPAQVSEVAR